MFFGVSNLEKGMIFALVGIVFLMWSLDRVPKLYQLKFKGVNAQLHEEQIIY